MLRRIIVFLALPIFANACGGDGGGGTDPGTGTQTLLVDANVDFEGGGARFDIDVRRAGVDVLDAVVLVDSQFGEVTLVHTGGGTYEGSQAGWAESYRIYVESGEDNLDGSITAPQVPQLLTPTSGQAIDPRNEDDGLVTVEWAGDAADRVDVKTKDFEVGPIPDEGFLEIPATVWVEESQELKVDRENSVVLAGGAPGSTLEAQAGAKLDVIVLNPF